MRKGGMSAGLLIFTFAVGIPMMLLLEHPVVFWMIFLPLLIIGIVCLVYWLKK